MASYVVMTASGRPGAESRDTVFVRDGFALFAFLMPWLWLAWHRLWLEALAAFAAAIALAGLGTLAGFSVAAPLLSLLVSLYVGLEARALRVAALRRRGWTEWGVVEADSLDDADIRYVTSAAVEDGAVAEPPVPMAATSSPRPFVAQAPHGLLLSSGNR